MTDLIVSVAMGSARHCFDSTVPSIYGDYKNLYDITAGRLCGAEKGDLEHRATGAPIKA